MNAPIVSFNHVGKSFDVDGFELEAIREFNLEVAEGEFVAIVGASGCGKSTLLRLLVGLDTQFRGEIRVDGNAVSGIGGERGIVFQEHRLFPWLTVAQNIGLGLVNEPLSEARAHAAHQRFYRAGGPYRLHPCLPAPTLRRHGATGGDCPRPGGQPAHPVAGRALRRPRRADSSADAG